MVEKKLDLLKKELFCPPMVKCSGLDLAWMSQDGTWFCAYTLWEVHSFCWLWFWVWPSKLKVFLSCKVIAPVAHAPPLFLPYPEIININMLHFVCPAPDLFSTCTTTFKPRLVPLIISISSELLGSTSSILFKKNYYRL